MSQAVARKPQVTGTPGLAGLPRDLRRRAVQVCDGAGQDLGLQLTAWWALSGPHLHPSLLHSDHAVLFADLSHFLQFGSWDHPFSVSG